MTSTVAALWPVVLLTLCACGLLALGLGVALGLLDDFDDELEPFDDTRSTEQQAAELAALGRCWQRITDEVHR